ncbi:ATP-binding protein [Marinobacter sp. F3R08]|uniref:ATP-binding protein n=1 Tax=Marinobacter sp. F3R08 TaxID=2841559 RepID=UPI001C08E40B|nr:ATP-binding protein [Marinobacter sp. F3R08]MBU2955801.1 HAMP domain-containing protein [Marinobacter sp. F3R08]
MIGQWRYWRLKTKLLFLTLFTSALGISLVCISLIFVENQNYRKQLESELHVIGGILAEQSAAALIFDDKEQLSSIISSLRRIDNIRQVCIYNSQGSIMAALESEDVRTCPELEPAPETGFAKNAYRMMMPITLDQETVGQLFLTSHLEVLRKHIRTFVLITAFVGIGILLVLFILAIKLQKIVSGPIVTLSDTAERIARDHDYTVRAPVSGPDELGRLGNTFNEMIGTIEEQNRRILESRDSLEREVDARTSELSMANRELEAFSYSVSHDLRQPLRAIEGFGQALEEDCGEQLDDAGKDYLRRIRNASVRMANLIDGLLILSRVSRQSMEKEPVDLTALLQEIADELLEIGDTLPTEINIQPAMQVIGDSRMLRVAFQNLLENAWKYSAKGEKRKIDVSAVTRNGSIEIAVKDNGVGFDMRYIDKLFVAFNRLHTPSEFSGTGIGLATVYRVVRRHRGQISATSEVGKGAHFVVTLPVSGKQR